MALIDKLTNIADAIREQTGETGKLSLDDMATSIGGISSTNFEVVGGTTEPVNPNENTIWVNSEAEVTNYDFSSTEPRLRSGNKNLLLYPYYDATKTDNGITFTSNADGTITANGTSGTEKADSVFDIIYCWDNTQNYPLEVGKTYTLSGCPSGGGSGYYLQAVFRSASNTVSYGIDTGSGRTFTADTTKYRIGVRIVIASGTKVSNIVFKPQLEKGSSATSFVKGDAMGQVWISASTSSHIPFNALKKNGVMVYPTTAKQYINGAWTYKEAKIYQGGSWVNLWDGYLYKDGNEYTEVTGGWDCFGKRLEEWSGSGGAGTPIMTRNVDSLTMATAGNGSGTIHYCKNKIDLTNYNTLKYIGTLTNSASDIWHMLCVWSEFGAYCDSNRAAWSPLDGTAGSTLSIDVSALSGEFYIGFSIYTSPAVTMTKLWLE